MSSQTPILEVSHLPSASSFYAAITQPLGLQYLSASSPSAPIPCLHYGTISKTESGSTRRNIVFSIAQAPSASPILSNISLSAPSEKALTDFHKKSEFLNKSFKYHTIDRIKTEGAEYLIAKIQDFDGNMIQAAYTDHDGASQAGSQRGERNDSRSVVGWQDNVARSVVSGASASTFDPGPGTFRRSNTCPAPSRVMERHTVTTETYRRQHPELSRSVSQPVVAPAESKGLSSKVIGTLLGAAAGAAFAYAMVRSESPEPAPAPIPMAMSANPRRASYDQQPQSHGSEDWHREHHVVERIPARSVVSERSSASARDVRPRYVEQYSEAGTGVQDDRYMDQGDRYMERIDEGSYVSGSGRSRVTAEALQMLPAPSRAPSHVSTSSHRSGSKHHSSRESAVSERYAPSHRDDASHVSARSHRTERTLVPETAQSVHSNYITGAPSKAGSSAGSTVTLRVSGSSRVGSRAGSQADVPRSVVAESRSGGSRVSGSSRVGGSSRADDGGSRVGGSSRVDDGGSRVEGSRSGGSRVGGSSRVSVRASQVELPESNADEDSDGMEKYAASVAPSDSVSCVGTKRERIQFVQRMGRFSG